MYVILLLNLRDCCLKGKERGGIKRTKGRALIPLSLLDSYYASYLRLSEAKLTVFVLD